MKQLTIHSLLIALLLSTSPLFAQKVETEPSVDSKEDKETKEEWIQLFNGKDLEGWTPKIRYHAYGENPGDTFRVEDGLLKVSYDKYDEFGEKFGHLYYKDEFSHYILRIEYRFVGEQCKGGPGWAFRNSGAMLHCEDPQGIGKDQDFPVSIEMQMLGGKAEGKRTTSNLCTPGTNVVMDGKLFKPHCINSTSETYRGDKWVTVEVEVHGDKKIKHLIDGKVVIEYDQPQLDPRDGHAKELIEKNGGNLLLSKGYISIQSESHPVHFRKIEIKILDEK